MAYAAFLTSTYLKKHNIFSENVDTKLIEPIIRQAQEVNIHQILGSDLYNKLVTDVDTSGTSTGAYLTLLTDYIQPCLAQWVKYYTYFDANYRITNISVSEKNSEHSSPTSLDNVKFIASQTKNVAEYYSQRVTDYIRDNVSSFPEYTTNGSYSIQPKSNNYFCGIYLPDNENNCDNYYD